MTQIFELIMQYPLQFLAGLGVSSATVFAIIKFLKFFFSLFFRKRDKKKMQETFESIANTVVNKIGLEEVKDKIVGEVIDELSKQVKTLVSNFKAENKTLNKKTEKLIMELSDVLAYIKTVLSESENEELLLNYNEVKNRLTEAKTQEIEELNKVDEIEQPQLENVAESEHIIQPAEYISVPQEIAPKTPKGETKDETEVDYV